MDVPFCKSNEIKAVFLLFGKKEHGSNVPSPEPLF
jgi:hypothetical protein